MYLLYIQSMQSIYAVGSLSSAILYITEPCNWQICIILHTTHQIYVSFVPQGKS